MKEIKNQFSIMISENRLRNDLLNPHLEDDSVNNFRFDFNNNDLSNQSNINPVLPLDEQKPNSEENFLHSLHPLMDPSILNVNNSEHGSQLHPLASLNLLNLSNLLSSEKEIQVFNSPEKIKRKRARYDKSMSRYKCQICEKTYLSLSALYLHKKSKHKNIITSKRNSKLIVSLKNKISTNNNNNNQEKDSNSLIINAKENSIIQKNVEFPIDSSCIQQNNSVNCLIPLKSLDQVHSNNIAESSSNFVNSIPLCEDILSEHEIEQNKKACNLIDQGYEKSINPFISGNQSNISPLLKSLKYSSKTNFKYTKRPKFNENTIKIKDEKEYQLPIIYSIKRCYCGIYKSIKHDFNNDSLYNLLLICHELNLLEIKYNHHHFKNYLKFPEKINYSFKNIDRYCCDSIFFKFLSQQSQKSRKSEFENCSIYLIRFRRFLNCLDINGKLKWEFMNKDDPPDFCQNNDTIELPIFANQFIEDFYDFYHLEIEEFEARQNATIYIFKFLQWLFDNDYTYYKPEIRNIF